MPTALPLIYDLDHEELALTLKGWGQPAYRAGQIWEGLYRKLWDDPQSFTGLPQDLRRRLGETYEFSSFKPSAVLKSTDGGTVKTLFRLDDTRAVEAVLMRYDRRRTLCISSQAGCAMGCVFCATGQMGFQRNLSAGEITAQVLHYARELGSDAEKVTNVVVMGMGEPFHNYDAVMDAIDRLNDPRGFDFGARRFTISTVGLVPAIRRFTAEHRQVNLAVSLHAADDDLRSQMLPINRKYPLDELLTACLDYILETRRRITFEWALIQDLNDSPEQATRLAERLRPFIQDGSALCHVNVIPLNPTRRYSGAGSTRSRAEAFQQTLEGRGIPCTVRMRRGIDIQAGCGQLAVEKLG